jgi:uncharacterized coiled-coil protein SlyX
MTLEPHPLQPG